MKNVTSKEITRRETLKRLGLAVGVAYIAPTITCLGTARAASSASEASNPSPPSSSSEPTPPTPPSPPSGVDISSDEPDDLTTDTCRGNFSNSDQLVIRQRDFERAEKAVEAGYAKPLASIWDDVVGRYDGRIIEIQFTGFRYRPRYRLKAISAAGRLETLVVSARTGLIISVVGC